MAFLVNMILSIANFSLNYIIMFNYAINEYFMAEGALFMSNNVIKEDTKNNKKRIGAKYE